MEKDGSTMSSPNYIGVLPAQLVFVEMSVALRSTLLRDGHYQTPRVNALQVWASAWLVANYLLLDRGTAHGTKPFRPYRGNMFIVGYYFIGTFTLALARIDAAQNVLKDVFLIIEASRTAFMLNGKRPLQGKTNS